MSSVSSSSSSLKMARENLKLKVRAMRTRFKKKHQEFIKFMMKTGSNDSLADQLNEYDCCCYYDQFEHQQQSAVAKHPIYENCSSVTSQELYVDCVAVNQICKDCVNTTLVSIEKYMAHVDSQQQAVPQTQSSSMSRTSTPIYLKTRRQQQQRYNTSSLSMSKKQAKDMKKRKSRGTDCVVMGNVELFDQDDECQMRMLKKSRSSNDHTNKKNKKQSRVKATIKSVSINQIVHDNNMYNDYLLSSMRIDEFQDLGDIKVWYV